MKYKFYRALEWAPDANKCQSSAYLDIKLPSNVTKLKLYSEVSCSNTNAQWQGCDIFYESRLREYRFANSEDHGHIAAKHEILSIEYNDGTPDYHKQICIKKKTQFKWDMDEDMIKEFRTCEPRRMFLSDTFDEDNQNWGLWILPMDKYHTKIQDRDVMIALYLYKQPFECNDIYVDCTVVDNGSGRQYKDEFVFDGEGWSGLYMFKSTELWNIQSLSVTVELEIIDIAWKIGVDEATKNSILLSV